jgi:hypothetical protein
LRNPFRGQQQKRRSDMERYAEREKEREREREKERE